MSGVVLRCPSCGTTQSHAGECDACSEGEVRSFCSNHSPGLWLDGQVCARCGARLGEARPEREPVPAREGRPPVSRLPTPDAEPPRKSIRRPSPRPADPEETPVTPSLSDLLTELSEERERTRARIEDAPWREPVTGPTRRSIPVMGCFLRLILLVLLLIALVIGGLSFVIGGF